MQGPQGLAPEDIRAAQQRIVHVVVKNDAGQVEDGFICTLYQASADLMSLPEGWSADVTDVPEEAQSEEMRKLTSTT